MSTNAGNRTTTIEWTNHTWNPMVGCSRASAGCSNCYAERFAYRKGNMQKAADDDLSSDDSYAYAGVTENWRWTGKINRNSDAVVLKPTQIRKPSMIFCASMSDFWHPNVPSKVRAEALDIMDETPRHRYQILTKRPELITPTLRKLGRKLPENAWIGATVEDQRVASRIDALRAVPAHVHFLSVEPLLGSLRDIDLTGIDWVIVGGESGPGARPVNPVWVRDIRDQCKAAKVAFFFKQWGTPSHNPLAAEFSRKRKERETLAAYIKRVDGGHGGSLLDGRYYKVFPNDPTWHGGQ